jgi:VanZ family protein
MKTLISIRAWLPALILMAVIFLLSSIPAEELPKIGSFDNIVKKSGHMAGYGALAACYWLGLSFAPKRKWLALLLCMLFALSDEYHQYHVPGRNASLVDALVFDGGGALVGLSVTAWIRMKKGRKVKEDDQPG